MKPTSNGRSEKNQQQDSQRDDTIGDAAPELATLLRRGFLVLIAAFALYWRVDRVVRLDLANGEINDLRNLRIAKELENGINYSKAFDRVQFPGTAFAAALSHTATNFVGIHLDAEQVCRLVTPLFAVALVFATYYFAKQIKDETCGIFAALFIGLAPCVLQVSFAGKLTGAAGGLFFLVLSAGWFAKSLSSGNIAYSALSALSYIVLATFWSGFVLFLNNLAAFAVASVLLQKTNNTLPSYAVFYVISTTLSLGIPFLGTNFLVSKECVFAHIAMVVLLLNAVSKSIGVFVAKFSLVIVFLLYFLGITGPSAAGNALYRELFTSDTSTWTTFFRDLHLVLFIFPTGLLWCLLKMSESNLFLAVCGFFGLLVGGAWSSANIYFAPFACTLAGVAAGITFKTYLNFQEKAGTTSREIKAALLIGISVMCVLYVAYAISLATHPSSYEHPLVMKAKSEMSKKPPFVVDDMREAISWLSSNTKPNSTILSWTGIGQDIASISRTSVSSSAAGQIFLVSEDEAYPKMKQLGVDYVLIIFGGRLGFAQDDLSAAEELVLSQNNDATKVSFSRNSLLYQLSYSGYQSEMTAWDKEPGFDNVRKYSVSAETLRPLRHLEETFTTRHWLVRIFRVRTEQ